MHDRVALFLMDYPNRTRLKIIGHARVEDAAEHPELFAQLAEPEIARAVERFFFIDVLSFDWNCQQYITPRYTLAEMEELISPSNVGSQTSNPRFRAEGRRFVTNPEASEALIIDF